MSALSDVKIVELSSGVAAEYCGKLLADFGAAGHQDRTAGLWQRYATRMGPFAASGPEAERSGMFALPERQQTLRGFGPARSRR